MSPAAATSPFPIYYLGDSHVRYFRRAAQHGLLAHGELTGLEVGGATAVGMRNPNAKTNAIGRYREWISDKPRDAIVVIHLGEVDCGFVIWYRAAKYDERVQAQARQSVEAYFEFVDELIAAGFRRIVITGATLPTISDDDLVGEVVQKRSSITATQRERTDLTMQYNRALASEAQRRNLPFVDIASDIIDPVAGVVKARLRNRNPEDHHMDLDIAGVHWARHLRPVLAEYHGLTPEPRGWQCVRDSYAKALPVHSRLLSSDMLQAIKIGDQIEADLVGEFGEYLLVENLAVNGSDFPLLSLLHKAHLKDAV
ncbi:hypothetical protein ACI7YT_03835 [Microbacterium sp. M]|uniref:hypothetical protein n=1 Tax=Microbacterium sp. M TaxID=3377125 RepID=UPI0038702C21